MSELLVSIIIGSLCGLCIAFGAGFYFYSKTKTDRHVETTEGKSELFETTSELIQTKHELTQKQLTEQFGKFNAEITDMKDIIQQLSQKLNQVESTANFAREQAHKHSFWGGKV